MTPQSTQSPQSPASKFSDSDIEFAQKIMQNEDSKALISSIGEDTFEKVEKNSKVLETKVSQMGTGETQEKIKELMLNLDSKIQELSPKKNLNDIGFIDSMIFKIKGTTPIKELQSKYVSSADVIRDLTESLVGHQLTLKEANIEHEISRKRYIKDIETLTNQKNQLEKVLELVQQEIEKETDEVKADRLRTQKAVPLVRKISELGEIILITSQGELASNILIDGNEQQIQTLKSVQRVTIKALEIGMQIAVGLDVQKKAIEMANMAKETSNSLIMNNAQALKNQAKDIAKLSSDTVVDIDVLQEAIDMAIDTLKQGKDNDLKMYNNGLENISKMNDLNNRFKEAKDNGDFSLENSDIIDVETSNSSKLYNPARISA